MLPVLWGLLKMVMVTSCMITNLAHSLPQIQFALLLSVQQAEYLWNGPESWEPRKTIIILHLPSLWNIKSFRKWKLEEKKLKTMKLTLSMQSPKWTLIMLISWMSIVILMSSRGTILKTKRKTAVGLVVHDFRRNE